VLLQGSALEAQRAGAAGAVTAAGALRGVSARPALRLWGAICHGDEDMRRAATLGADFVLLGPVLAPRAGQPALGWAAFQSLAADASMPVLAFGGTADAVLNDALRAGAHGIAIDLQGARHREGFGGHA
jgi:hypothetical protein